jgi:hypothetical protein
MGDVANNDRQVTLFIDGIFFKWSLLTNTWKAALTQHSATSIENQFTALLMSALMLLM